ncbi:hypothetical protein [Candidatus Nitrosotenuis cloacae]|uniref:hypothetical protein n=1 Tax=Candidatus Nitrosotenuis cloacae TaxID=1603555 RepID=UPI002281BEC2|nr:hypothetical protein [Candidatus Nitrosotenuis cloacae]
MSSINYSPVSRPFVVSAVILSFVGVSIGSLWMLSLLGLKVPEIHSVFSIHRVIQLEGFLTLLIMGISYMIIPRFRNSSLPSNKLATVSFLLVVISVVMESVQRVTGYDDLFYADVIRLTGVLIFAGMIFYVMRVVPKLLKEADYFFVISISMLVAVHILSMLGAPQTGSLSQIHLWLLFPILAIFGVEHKTLPSFLGFIRPRRTLTALCLAAAVASCGLGVSSVYLQIPEVAVAFDGAVILTASLFALSVYIFGGHDNSEMLKLMPGEKKARYDMIVRHTRIAFSFLVAGFSLGIASHLQNSFLFYDLAIHYVAIGFIGVTIMVFLPLMLPPIIGKTIHFLKFNKIPIVLILSALALRTIGDYVIDDSAGNPALSFFGISGIVVLAGMVCFVVMIHKAMSAIPSVDVEFKKR